MDGSRKISAGDVLDGQKPGAAMAMELEMKQRSLSTPNTPRQDGLNPMMDPYSRARTVRIGKWRWPPPKDELQGDQSGAGGATSEGFFEFKMRKMSEKMSGLDPSSAGHLDEPSTEMEHFEWSQEELEPEQQTDPSHIESPASGGASVGKLKLTSQMKEKLEAVTGGSGSRKNSIKSTASKKSEEGSMDEATAGILAEKKKLLMEQKLGAGKTMSGLIWLSGECSPLKTLKSFGV